MRIDDHWSQQALDILSGITANGIITSLRPYSYDELKAYDFIASCTTGTDHLDHRDIPLISLKGETDFLQDVWATAEHTLGLMLALVRRIPFAFDDVRAGYWNREAWQGTELQGKRLLIVGHGRVGKQVEQLARAFGMKVGWWDTGNKPISHQARCDYHDLLIQADIVSLHMSLTSLSEMAFGKAEFFRMSSTAYFINTSRGAVVDEDTLLFVLKNYLIAGAALDVVCNEPHPNPRLIEYARTHHNLIITPHIAGNTAESREKTQVFIAKKIVEFVKS